MSLTLLANTCWLPSMPSEVIAHFSLNYDNSHLGFEFTTTFSNSKPFPSCMHILQEVSEVQSSICNWKQKGRPGISLPTSLQPQIASIGTWLAGDAPSWQGCHSQTRAWIHIPFSGAGWLWEIQRGVRLGSELIHSVITIKIKQQLSRHLKRWDDLSFQTFW